MYDDDFTMEHAKIKNLNSRYLVKTSSAQYSRSLVNLKCDTLTGNPLGLPPKNEIKNTCPLYIRKSGKGQLAKHLWQCLM